MMQTIALEFSKRYFSCLSEFLNALPKRASLPACFKETSFIISCEDIHGKISLEFISRKNRSKIEVNGRCLSPGLEDQPRLVVPNKVDCIEQFLFPQDDKRSSISLPVNVRYVVLEGLAFSNKEYNEKYWKDAEFYRNTSGTIPFSVTSSGSMLGLELWWGAELSGQQRERLFEFIKIYGNVDMIPCSDKDFIDEVYRDFVHAASELRKIPADWSFSKFLSGLEGPLDQNVLLLGSYKSDRDFDMLRTALGELGYHAFLLKDSPDLPIQTNMEKLFAAIICSCFIIVVDKEASGHIAELGTMLQYNFRPVIVLREKPQPATTFLEDRILPSEFFKVAVIQDIESSTLLPYIRWAREIVDNQIKALKKINQWRQ